MKENRYYILIISLLTLAMAAAMILLPRSTVSVLERRTLNEIPEFSFETLANGDYTKAISEWFADTIPERDRVTEASLAVEEMLGSRRQSEETYRFYGVEMAAVQEEEGDITGSAVEEKNEDAHEDAEADKTDETDISDKAGNADKTDESYEPVDDGATDKTDNPDETGEHDESDKTDETGSVGKSDSQLSTANAPDEGSADITGQEESEGGSTGSTSNKTDTATPETVNAPEETESAEENRQIAEADAVPPDEAFTVAANGIVIIGSGETTRAIMMYGGSTEVTTRYAEIVNKYHELMPSLNIYCMVIPTSVSFYLPSNLSGYTGSQLKQINNVMEHLAPGVHGVDAYTILGQHRDEPIYLRTDHHWAPLGAYYAASKVAEAAGLPFLDISAYDEYRLHNYVGTMYMYSNDISVKNNPEDFVYYIPRDVGLTTTYINYKLDSKWNVIGKNEPTEGSFFQKRKDGDSDAYCTFMGGDAKITQVKTTTTNGRRLIILKDSYGNALPAFLFGSFEEIHVVDSRYFKENIIDYVREHGITDMLFANNAFHASTKSTVNSYERYLTQ